MAPLKSALTSLQSKLHPTSKLWGSVTRDLLQQLSEAALFQELCSGDMHAVPGLMTSSRLNCFMHLLTVEAASPSSRSLLQPKGGQPPAGGDVVKTSTATASLNGVSCLDGTSTSKGDAAAAVESLQDGIFPAEGEAALASSSTAHFDKPMLLPDRNGGATEHSKPDEEALRRAVIYVGENVTAQRSVVYVIPLFHVSHHYVIPLCDSTPDLCCMCMWRHMCRELPHEITNLWSAKRWCTSSAIAIPHLMRPL